MAEQKKKESLTPEEQILLEEHFQESLKIGMSTSRANRPAAETAITEMYQLAGYQPPKFMWFLSPASMCVAFAQLKQRDKIEGELQSKLKELVAKHAAKKGKKVAASA